MAADSLTKRRQSKLSEFWGEVLPVNQKHPKARLCCWPVLQSSRLCKPILRPNRSTLSEGSVCLRVGTKVERRSAGFDTLVEVSKFQVAGLGCVCLHLVPWIRAEPNCLPCSETAGLRGFNRSQDAQSHTRTHTYTHPEFAAIRVQHELRNSGQGMQEK